MQLPTSSLDGILQRAVSATPAVPGVVAMVTDRDQTLYSGAAGVQGPGAAPMAEDTVFAMFSTTKAVAGTAVLQCVEEGLLDLDAPAKDYLPAIAGLQVLDGFDGQGQPQLRAPKTDLTARHLLTHTGGFAYDFFNEKYLTLALEHGQPSVISCTRAALETPLLFDPGSQWEYGTNIDWAGLIVEQLRGQRLSQVLRERVFEPLAMRDIGFTRSPSMRERTAAVYAREANGGLQDMNLFLPDQPEVDCGGHGLYASIPEYMKFIRMWLNDGAGPSGQVLKPDTVAMATRNQLLPHQRVKLLPGVIPALSNDAEMYPGLRKGWSFTFMTLEEDAPTGRPSGSVGWAGLANLYYWIDRHHGIGGFWASQVLPFADPASYGGYLEFETEVYRAVHGG